MWTLPVSEYLHLTLQQTQKATLAWHNVTFLHMKVAATTLAYALYKSPNPVSILLK